MRAFGVWHGQHRRGDCDQTGARVRNDQGHRETVRHAGGRNRHRQDLHAARGRVQGRRHHPRVARGRSDRDRLGFLEGDGVGEVPLRRPALTRVGVAAHGQERPRRRRADERRRQFHARTRQGRHAHSLRDHQRRRPAQRGAAERRGLVLPPRQQAHRRRGLLRVAHGDRARSRGDEPDEAHRVARRSRHARGPAEPHARRVDSQESATGWSAGVRRPRESVRARDTKGSETAAGARARRAHRAAARRRARAGHPLNRRRRFDLVLPGRPVHGRHLQLRRARPQLAGRGLHRHEHRREGHAGRGEDDRRHRRRSVSHAGDDRKGARRSETDDGWTRSTRR